MVGWGCCERGLESGGGVQVDCRVCMLALYEAWCEELSVRSVVNSNTQLRLRLSSSYICLRDGQAGSHACARN